VAALFLDAIFLSVRPDGPKEGVLVAWGFTEQGERVLLAVMLGMRESHEDWLELGRDLIARGLGAPLLIVADGAPGLIKAIEPVLARLGSPALRRAPRAQPVEVAEPRRGVLVARVEATLELGVPDRGCDRVRVGVAMIGDGRCHDSAGPVRSVIRQRRTERGGASRHVDAHHGLTGPPPPWDGRARNVGAV
jgi:hypothetical protein